MSETKQLLTELNKQFNMQKLFDLFTEDENNQFINGLSEVKLDTNEYLFKQNDSSDAMYFVIGGRLQKEVLKSNGSTVKSATINPENPVGEVQMLTGGKRMFSVFALVPTQLVKLEKDTFDALIKNPKIENYMIEFIREYMRQGLLGNILSAIFDTVDEQTEKDIEAEIEWVDLDGGQTLFKQGDTSDAMYIILSGCLQNQTITQDGKKKILGEIKKGESIGTSEMITGQKRISTIYAIRDSELAKLSKESFDKLTNKYPVILRKIAQRVSLRFIEQARNERPARDEEVTVALLPHDNDADIQDFAQRLGTALTNMDPTYIVNSAKIDQELGEGIAQTTSDAANDIRVTTWLNNIEKQHRFILYIADNEATEWTKRCIRQAEQILIVGSATSNPQLSAIEEKYLQADNLASIADQSLVLLHPDGSKNPKGTQRWLDVRNVGLHHHVRMDRDSDIARVSRFIAGTATGLALGGGGARGFAHIGALKVMEELNIPIDIIGGTSMGSYISGEYVLGWEESEMIDKSKKIFNLGVYDVTLPISSIISGKKLANRLMKFFGDVEIPDMWLPYFCVSSNISRGEMKIHRKGPLWRAMRASGGVQGLVPPIVDEGDLLVDGALLSNLPADAMKIMNPSGLIIAVDVSPPEDLKENPNYGKSLSGWKILWSRVLPWKKEIKMPSLGEVMQRSAELASQARQKNAIHNMTDLYIRMPVDKFELLEFGKADDIIATGYEHAKKVFNEWVAERA